MLSELSHLQVNWVDGMKISRKHFQQTEEFINEQLKDINAQQITPFNFGILPSENPLILEVQCDFNQQILVTVKYCDAVTPNGSRIFISPLQDIKTSIHFKDIAAQYALQTALPQTLFIILSINPFSRLPYGEPAVDENPPRHPYSQPEINVNVLPAEQIKSQQLGNNLIIGKIVYSNGELIYQREFIPPCTMVNCLPILKDWYSRFRSVLESLESNSFKIIEKIQVKGQENKLTVCIGKLAERIVLDIAGIRTHYRWIIPFSSPIFLCELLIQFLQQINTSLLCFSSSDREEVINYFTEWTNLQQGIIQKQTAGALQIQYDHNDLSKILGEIYQVYNMYQQIFEEMVKLEYIGKHKGEGVIYIDKKVEVQPEKKWSPLE